MDSELTIDIECPLNQVYAAFRDQKNVPRWIQGLQRLEPLDGEPGAIGSRTRQIFLEQGRETELIETITAHEPMKGLSLKISGAGMECDVHVAFEDQGDRTTLTLRSSVRSSTAMMSVMLPMIREHIRDRQQGDLKRFKELLEAGELTF